MKTSDVFPSKYLKAEELDDDLVVTIKYVELTSLKTQDGKDEKKPVMYFKEVEKGLILNKTNWQRIADQYGDESDSWGDSQVTLTVVEVSAFGDIVDAIRIEKQRNTAPRPQGGARPKVKIAQDAVTTFWVYVGKHNLDGNALVAAANGNFVDAYDRATAEVAENGQLDAVEEYSERPESMP